MSATQDQPDEKPHYQDAYPAEAATPQDDDGEVQQAIQVTNPYMEKYMHYKISEPYRYFLLMVGCCGCFLASFSYSFALYAGNMMVDAHLDMAKMATISTVMLVFSYFTLPYAFIYDAFGPTPVLVAGTILLPLGSLLMALTFDGHIKATTATYSVFLGILGGGCIIFDLATVVSVLSWFPINRGPVVAIMKSFAGLGLAILGTIQLAFFEVQPASFFYFMMALALFLGLTCIAFMRLPPYHLTSNMVKTLSDDEKAARHLTKELFLSQKATPWRMYYALGVVIFLIIFLPLQSLLIVYDDLSRKYKIAFCFVVIAGLLAYSFSCIPIHLFGENSGLEDEEGLDAEQALEAEDMPHACVVGDEAEEEAELVHDLEHLAPQFQSTFLEGLRTIRLWGIFVCCFAVIGAQLVILFNYTYIVAAIRKELTDSKFKTLLTTMSGVGSAVGRLLLAWFEVWSQNRAAEDRLPVSMCLFFPVFFTTLGLLLYVVLPGGALPVAHFIVSMGNGTAAAAAVLVFRGIFAKEPAKHYNFGFLAAMVSAIIFNRVLYAEWYVHRLGQLPLKDTIYGLVCLEKSCVLMPLLLMLGLNALSFFGAFYVNWEYSAYCRDVLASRAAALAEDPEHGHAPDSEEIDPNQKLDNVSSSNEPANA